ncbi:MAG: hypothetical protein IPJ41_10770 [Phycisphaerales bacterium]|nr:hypothetical protein [Phycisphaerales bacterium]
MTTKPGTTRADTPTRASWSTRLVILIAFAVQLAPVSERLGTPSFRAERLAMLEGSLAGLWLAEGRIHDVAGERPGASLPGRSVSQGYFPRPVAPEGYLTSLAAVGHALLPTPPPSRAS